MRKLTLILLLSLCVFTPSVGALPDSLSLHIVELAMRGDVRSLRPLYAEYRDSLSTMCRLACDLTLAEDDSDDRRFVECVDSLTRLYSRLIPTANRAAWEIQKAAALCRLGRYDEAARFCRQRLELMDRDERDSPMADDLRFYEEKGKRYADTVSFRGRLLGAIDRSDLPFILRLSTLPDTTDLDPYARLRLQAAVGAALNRPSCVTSAVNALFRNYTDSLPDAEAGILFSLAADELAFTGHWAALDSLCSRFSSAFGTWHPDLSHYRYLARSLADCLQTSVHRPQGQAFTLTSYDWPLTTDIGVNGRLLNATIIDTGTPFTLLSRADAEAAGVRILTDTVKVATLFGLTTATTGYADEITIGGLSLRHVRILVRTAGDDASGHPLTNILGLNELRRIGRIEFLADRLKFPQPQPSDRHTRPNFHLTPQGVRFPASHEGSTYLFSFDTGTATQVLSAVTFPPERTDTVRFALDFEGKHVRLPYTVLASGKAPDNDGLLGIGFVRGFARFSIDFNTMRMEGHAVASHPHRHLSAADWFNRHDSYALERNAASLSLLQPARERELTNLLVLLGKNRPDSVIAMIDRELSRTDYTTAIRLDFLKQKELALEDLGRYHEAMATLDEIVRLGSPSRKLAAESRAKHAYLKALLHVAPPVFRLNASTFIPRLADGSYAATLNGEPASVTVSPDHFTTTMPERTAKKMGVNVILKHHHVGANKLKVGLIDSLRVGNAVIRNLIVYLVKDKKAPISLGMDFLRHAGEARFTASSLILSPTGSLGFDATSIPLRLSDGLPVMQPAADLLPPYDIPKLRTQFGTPYPEAFINQLESLTLDFEHMRLK